MISKMAKALYLDLPCQAPEEYAGATWQQLKEMQDAGIEIGGHTMTHPSLGCVDDRAARNEILGCMTELKSCLGVRPRTFCYPNGTASDFTPELKTIVREAGFKGAVLAYPDAADARDRHALQRHSAGEGRFQFQKAITGMELIGLKLRAAVGMKHIG